MINSCNKNCRKCRMKKTKRCKGCSMCDIAVCKCNKKENDCIIICPKKFGSFSLVKKTLSKEILLSNKEFNFPIHIPLIPDSTLGKFNIYNVNSIIAVNGKFLLNLKGTEIATSYKKGFRFALNLSKNTQGILDFNMKYGTLEGFWRNRHSLYSELKKQNFIAIIIPKFPLYEDAPRLEQLYNIQRSKIVYNEMRNEGLPAILDISWAEEEDLKFWINEINTSKISTISFSFINDEKRFRTSNTWQYYILGFKTLLSKIPHDIEIVISGLSSTRTIEELLKLTGNRQITFLHQSVWLNSINRVSVKEKKQLDKHIKKDFIFHNNLNFYITEYERLKKTYS